MNPWLNSLFFSLLSLNVLELEVKFVIRKTNLSQNISITMYRLYMNRPENNAMTIVETRIFMIMNTTIGI